MSVFIAYRKLVAKNLNNKVQPVSINLNDTYFLERNLSCYKPLNSSDKKIFNSRLGLFLAEIKSKNTSDINISKEDWLCLASIIVILFWDRDYFSFLGHTVFWGEPKENSDFLYVDRVEVTLFLKDLNESDIISCRNHIEKSNELPFIKKLLVT